MADYIIAQNKYGKYAVPKSSQHRPTCQTILRGKVHEPQTIEYILNNAGDGDIVHAGAYFGDFLPALSTLPNQIFAFEPENYQCAKKTLELNQINNVILIKLGLGDGDIVDMSMVTIDIFDYSLGGRSFLSPQGSKQIIMARLDYFSLEPSLIHLDIGGYESYTLQGAINMIKEHKPVLILETVPNFVFDWGYKVEQKIEGNTILRCK